MAEQALFAEPACPSDYPTGEHRFDFGSPPHTWLALTTNAPTPVSPTIDVRGLVEICATYLRAHSVADSTFDQYKRALAK
ncbi:hypothetical protein PC119_g19036 [Phytophthora cactorum]|nr:hypothetical protein PC119_g19036 [Phytophthora cactorum]